MPDSTVRRRLLLAAGAGAILPRQVLAQPRKTARVAILHPGLPPPSPALYLLTAMHKGLRELGYVEGQTVVFEYRYGGGKSEALPALASELVSLKPDVMLVIGPAATSAARQIPGFPPLVVIDTQIDPVKSGLVASLSKPGGNITGLFFDFAELMGKMIGLLTETVPRLRRAAVLWDKASGQFESQFVALNDAAKQLSIALEVVEWRRPDELDAVLDAAIRKRPQALIQLPSPNNSQASARIASLTLAHRLPSISIFPAFAEAGGLMSYGPNLPAFFSAIAPLMHSIIKGARAGDLPIERPRTFEFVLNKGTAKALGLRVPDAVLYQVTRVIE
jgi:putative ABC transport system substrate-binding protein